MGRIGTPVLDAIARFVLAVCIFGTLGESPAGDAIRPSSTRGSRQGFAPGRHAEHPVVRQASDPAPRYEAPAANMLAQNENTVPRNEAYTATRARDVTVATPLRSESGDRALARAQRGADVAYSPPSFAQPSDFGSLLSRLLVATVGVLIACCMTLWLAKKYLVQSQAKGKSSSDGAMKMLASLRVSRRGCIQLVEVEDTKIVVAIDGGALRSVIPLTETFGKTLFDAVENIDDTKPRRRNIGNA